MYIFVLEREFQTFQGEEVILFGAGSGGEKCLEEFERLGAKVLGFCDNNRSRRGQLLRGYPIFAPEDLSEKKDVNIMITSTYDEQIREQLQQMEMPHVYTVKIGVLHDKLPLEKFQNPRYQKKEANQFLYEAIQHENAFFFGRLGSVELECLSHYCYLLERRKGNNLEYGNNLKMIMKEWAGFYPANELAMDRFSELYLQCLSQVDILSTMWNSKFEDKLYTEICPSIPIVPYEETVFPIEEACPWTMALQGKKVLIIHPFINSIQENYQKRNLLFKNSTFLPEFELIPLKAVQSQGYEVPEYKDWFAALEAMNTKISQIEFDVALIGAGAYGFPIAAHIKKLGKQGIHIGGMLQLFFGIKGKVWDDKGYYNEHWTRPLEEERPKGFERVEAGRYW